MASLRVGCDWTPSFPGDGIDNDCDGRVDEELIDRYGKCLVVNQVTFQSNTAFSYVFSTVYLIN